MNPMHSAEQLTGTISSLYESVLDESQWMTALRSLSDYAGGRGTFYVRANPRTGSIVHSESVDIDPLVNERYLEYYSTKEVRLPPSLLCPAGQILTEDMLIDRRALCRSEIYADLLLPFDIPNILMLWVEKAPDICSALVIERSYNQGAFSRAECQEFSPVVSHLVRAIRIRNELQRLRDRQRIFVNSIYRLPLAVILLDHTGRIIESSPVAASLLRAEQCIAQRNKRVRAIFPADDGRLQKAIFAVIDRRSRRQAGDTVYVKSKSANPMLSIYVIPVHTPDFFLDAAPACMLVIFDPVSSPKSSAAMIKQSLRLTDAEASLANLLFNGITLREAADRLQLSVNTCKSQLQSIYGKTGCKNHVELAKLVMAAGMTSSNAGLNPKFPS